MTGSVPNRINEKLCPPRTRDIKSLEVNTLYPDLFNSFSSIAAVVSIPCPAAPPIKRLYIRNHSYIFDFCVRGLMYYFPYVIILNQIVKEKPKMAEFVTDKGYDAKIVLSPCRQGSCYKVSIKYEDGWRPVLSIIGTKNTTDSIIIKRIKEHY